jgi:superfamily II DNA or RNA helicase
MSAKLTLSNVSPTELSSLRQDLLIRIDPKRGFPGPVKYITPYTIFTVETIEAPLRSENESTISDRRCEYTKKETSEEMIMPFAFAKQKGYQVPLRSSYECIENERMKFNGTLRDTQKDVAKNAKSIMAKIGSVLMSLPCAFGKTITSIYLATEIKLPCLVIVHSVVLLKQWVKEINRFCPQANVGVIDGKTNSLPPDCGFYVMNAINGRNKSLGFFDNIGLVIIDECHKIMAEVLVQSIQYVFPRYVIGLSATAYRDDGLDRLIDLYFGQRKVECAIANEKQEQDNIQGQQRSQNSEQGKFLSNQIIMSMNRPHTVYMVKTGFKPIVEKTAQGRTNWGSILDSQASDPDRNNIILNIISSHKTRKFLVLVKRVSQGKYLRDALIKMGESVTTLLGTDQTYDENARILIGTVQKIGTGFDHPSLDALIMAADVEAYFIQYLGRVFRRLDVIPFVFDLIDENSLLKKHFGSRKVTYIQSGGTLVNYIIGSLTASQLNPDRLLNKPVPTILPISPHTSATRDLRSETTATPRMLNRTSAPPPTSATRDLRSETTATPRMLNRTSAPPPTSATRDLRSETTATPRMLNKPPPTSATRDLISETTATPRLLNRTSAPPPTSATRDLISETTATPRLLNRTSAPPPTSATRDLRFETTATPRMLNR